MMGPAFDVLMEHGQTETDSLQRIARCHEVAKSVAVTQGYVLRDPLSEEPLLLSGGRTTAIVLPAASAIWNPADREFEHSRHVTLPR